MKSLIKLIGTVSLLFAAHAGFACDYPERIKLPDGATASKEQMLDGQRGVKSFVADIEIYLDCIVEEEKAARAAIQDLQPEDEQQREDKLNKKYNAAVEEMERLAAQFNAEVRIYRERDSG